MKSFIVTCPKCTNQFEPIEAQSQFIGQEVDRLLAQRKAQIAEQQKALATREASLKASEEALSEKVEQALQKKLGEAQKKAEAEVNKKVAIKLKDLENQVSEKDEALKEATEQQLQLTRQVREAQERQKKLDLEVEQKVMEQVESIQGEAMKQADETYKFKLAEKDKKIRDIEEQLASARRTAEQGSQQTQGEVAEEELEKLLAAQFPLDHFEPVPKGVEGADLIQVVHNAAARKCGTVVWEIKNTKNFGGDWVAKLKRDQQRVSADAAILVTRAMPKGAQDVEMIDGVLVVTFELALAIAKVVRKSLEDISYSQLAVQGQDEKMRLIYNYLTGSQFRLKVKAIVSAFTQMKAELETEKRAFKKMWASREKLLEQVIDSASSMYGDVEGIAGTAAPKIEELALYSAPLLEDTSQQVEA